MLTRGPLQIDFDHVVRGSLMRKPSVLVIFLTVFIDLIGFGIVVPLVPVYGKHLVPDVIKPVWAQGLTFGLEMRY